MADQRSVLPLWPRMHMLQVCPRRWSRNLIVPATIRPCMKRRDFLVATVGIATASGCSAGVKRTWVDDSGAITVELKEFEKESENDALRLVTDEHSVVLSRDDEGGFTAVSGICTHQQCSIHPTGNLLNCPCHGSAFTRQGQVVRGPARKALPRYPTSVEGESIRIQLSGTHSA